MFKDKPVISNQHGALAMAFVPFIYALFELGDQANYRHALFAIAWFFLYLFSYPFFSLFSKKPTARNQKWAIIYFTLSLLFASPILFQQPRLLYFLLPMIPLGIIQFYYAKMHNERHLINDMAGILTFGVVGMATFYLGAEKINWAILLHPTLFFIATTFYVKSLVRERKNPLYMKLSIGSHCALALLYAGIGMFGMVTAYLFALARAVIIPKLGWNVKKVGMFEFLTLSLFLTGLILS